jgi:hypothetical protein
VTADQDKLAGRVRAVQVTPSGEVAAVAEPEARAT